MTTPKKMPIYIDAGANVGDTVKAYHAKNPDHFQVALEANAALIPRLTGIFLDRGIHGTLFNAAAWVEDGTIDFHLGHHETSTLLTGKVVPASYKQQIDYANPVRVPCVDFSAMVRNLAKSAERIVVKMDIEGAEYSICEKMLKDDTLGLISELYCEWHWDRYPERFSRAYHEEIVSRVARCTDLRPWH